ncbi:MAG TPA: pirin family protein [Gammaproteobacteria bacterium]|nr:pirin family protein [Gammaproteobacteria bacterium]
MNEAAAAPVLENLPVHLATVGGDMQVRRALPHKLRRRVGAWCFLDHYGPVTLAPDAGGMRVGPHPHMGLQTVSWLYSGEVLHRDSLGSQQLITPGQLNLMTAGHGISHSEESPKPHPQDLHGLQFWIALPELARDREPAFDHHPALPALRRDGLEMSLIIGEALGERSPAKTYTPLVGLDIRLVEPGRRRLPLDPHFEHALLPIAGHLTVEGRQAELGALTYLGSGRDGLLLENDQPAHAFLLGGAPMQEEVLLWWNFVGRNDAEMRAASEQWQAHDARFGEVHGYDGPRVIAPELTARLKAHR